MTDWVDAGETSNSRKPSRHGFPTLPNNERQNRKSRNRVSPLERAMALIACGWRIAISLMIS